MRIALAASARDWSDRFHRSVLDHGGGTVVGRVMSPDQVAELAFDVLFIDDICSFLTPRLVFDIRSSGRSMVGVFSPEDGSEGKRRLLDAGISDVIETGASYEEFLVIARSAIDGLPDQPMSHPIASSPGMAIGVVGPPGGVGVTEIAVGISQNIALRQRTVLVDLNQSWPSVGQRLNLPVHPNLRTAVDYALHEPDRLAKAIHVDRALDVITGLANPGSGELPPADVASLINSLNQEYGRTVVDLGSTATGIKPLLLQCMDTILIVGTCDPVGLTRLVRTVEAVSEVVDNSKLALVLNRMPRSSRKRYEVTAQIGTFVPEIPMIIVEEDPGVARASWNGDMLDRGHFQKQMAGLGSLLGKQRR